MKFHCDETFKTQTSLLQECSAEILRRRIRVCCQTNQEAGPDWDTPGTCVSRAGGIRILAETYAKAEFFEKRSNRHSRLSRRRLNWTSLLRRPPLTIRRPDICSREKFKSKIWHKLHPVGTKWEREHPVDFVIGRHFFDLEVLAGHLDQEILRHRLAFLSRDPDGFLVKPGEAKAMSVHLPTSGVARRRIISDHPGHLPLQFP